LLQFRNAKMYVLEVRDIDQLMENCVSVRVVRSYSYCKERSVGSSQPDSVQKNASFLPETLVLLQGMMQHAIGSCARFFGDLRRHVQ